MKPPFFIARTRLATLVPALLLLCLLLAVPKTSQARRFFRLRCCRPAPSCCRAVAVHADSAPLANAPQPQPNPWTSLFDGKSLDGWTVAEENEFYQHGAVSVEGGKIQILMGSPSSGIRRTDEEAVLRDNYEMVFDARRVDGVDFFVGLTFPIDEEYCTLIVGGWSGAIVGLSNIDNFAAVDNESTLTRRFETDKWYRFRLRVTEHKVSVWIDKEQVIEVERKDRKFNIWWEVEPMRPLGISNWYTASQLKDLKVRRLTEEEIAADLEEPGN